MHRRLIIASVVLLLASACSGGTGSTVARSAAASTTALTSATTSPQVHDLPCPTCLDPNVQPTVAGKSTTIPGPTPLTVIVEGPQGTKVYFSLCADGTATSVGPSGVWTKSIQVHRSCAVVLSAFNPGPDGPSGVAYAIAYHGTPLLRRITDDNTGPDELTVIVQ